MVNAGYDSWGRPAGRMGARRGERQRHTLKEPAGEGWGGGGVQRDRERRADFCAQTGGGGGLGGGGCRGCAVRGGAAVRRRGLPVTDGISSARMRAHAVVAARRRGCIKADVRREMAAAPAAACWLSGARATYRRRTAQTVMGVRRRKRES